MSDRQKDKELEYKEPPFIENKRASFLFVVAQLVILGLLYLVLDFFFS